MSGKVVSILRSHVEAHSAGGLEARAGDHHHPAGDEDRAPAPADRHEANADR